MTPAEDFYLSVIQHCIRKGLYIAPHTYYDDPMIYSLVVNFISQLADDSKKLTELEIYVTYLHSKAVPC